MKKLLLIFIGIVLIVYSSHAQKNWIDYKIDSKLSVKLPAQPKVVRNNTVVSDRDNVMYVTFFVDFVKVANIDSTQLAAVVSTQEFADGLKSQILSKIPNSTTSDIKIGKWKDYYSYTADGETATKKFYCFMLVVGNSLYGLMTIIPIDKSTKGKDIFFNSLTLN